ncbi:MAG TPA: CPBP family intramembrane metalloprotease [Ferruginibacter sp.]|nr:CPBP family intramembrane metalloprotease [Ferruginibacter sp.]
MVFILSLVSKKEGSQRLIKDDGSISDKPGNIIGLHLIGIMWLGLVPVFALKLPVLKTLTGSGLQDSSLLIIFLVLLTLTAGAAIRAGKNVQQQILNADHNNFQLPAAYAIRYFIIRIIFLFVYELWFRGFLLFYCIETIGILLAVSVNVLLYVMLHLFNTKKEMLACIPFGLMACWLCILFNAVWPAVVLHITFSLLYEINIYQSHFTTSKTARV